MTWKLSSYHSFSVVAGASWGIERPNPYEECQVGWVDYFGWFTLFCFWVGELSLIFGNASASFSAEFCLFQRLILLSALTRGPVVGPKAG